VWVLYYIGLEATIGATFGKLVLGARPEKGRGFRW
jgi:hypothetical protein